MSKLNSYTPTPVTREEKILSGADIEPRTRMEYFLKKASEASSGVPSYTSNDAGKVLTLAETDETVTKFIIPPQTVTLVQSRADLANVIPIDEMIDGEIATFVFEHNGESGSIDMAAYIYKTEEDGVTSASYNDPNDDNSRFAIEYSLARGVWEILVWQGEGDITLSLFASTPTVAPKWEAPSEGGGSSLPPYTSSGIKTIKAEEFMMIYDNSHYIYYTNITVGELMSCFSVDNFVPVYVLLPEFTNNPPNYFTYNEYGGVPTCANSVYLDRPGVLTHSPDANTDRWSIFIDYNDQNALVMLDYMLLEQTI